eukprot:TRINITY_DN446_c0_g1_i1.p1 TRINITY_DN446_c0_g1~~TRINITY_DN446_c0_g1_i1.p1  ORF type:complete len:353 (+),score=54.86 TRINITY_DN446_c0_g1_i1:90-1148(+)
MENDDLIEDSETKIDKNSSSASIEKNDDSVFEGGDKVSVPDKDSSPIKKFLSFFGPALFVSVGYLDPGNWATDIEGGSSHGYQLLWILLMSNLMAMLLQTLSARLGVVVQRDLAEMCRLSYPKYVCWVLWFLCEIAIAATDMAEVLGTAIGLNLLIPQIPVVWAVILTALDTFLFLIIQHFGIRKLELIMGLLVFGISSCFVVELFLVKPVFVDVMTGFIPILSSKSLFIAIGILGATVMPHNFYLHSKLVQSRAIDKNNKEEVAQGCKYNLIDVIISLNIAFFVNASILIVSAATFFYSDHKEVKEFKEAYTLFEHLLNSKLASILFGVGLFCSGNTTMKVYQQLQQQQLQ